MDGQIKFRIKTPTIALIYEDGRQVARTIPCGAEVFVDDSSISENRLIEVRWRGSRVMMFSQDIRTRAERVER